MSGPLGEVVVASFDCRNVANDDDEDAFDDSAGEAPKKEKYALGNACESAPVEFDVTVSSPSGDRLVFE